jgi:hypothetical protein
MTPCKSPSSPRSDRRALRAGRAASHAARSARESASWRNLVLTVPAKCSRPRSAALGRAEDHRRQPGAAHHRKDPQAPWGWSRSRHPWPRLASRGRITLAEQPLPSDTRTSCRQAWLGAQSRGGTGRRVGTTLPGATVCPDPEAAGSPGERFRYWRHRVVRRAPCPHRGTSSDFMPVFAPFRATQIAFEAGV